MAEPICTPLHHEHVAAKATMVEFAGWLMPLRYTSDLVEHRAVRTAAGLFDLSHMGEITVEGPQAGAMLDQTLVSQLSGIAVGRAKYTMLCQVDGGVLDDLIVYRTGPEAFMVVANASNAHTVAANLLAAATTFDVKVTDISASTALVAVQGPAALGIMHKVVTLLDADEQAARDTLTNLKYYASVPMLVAGVEALVARTGYTGEDGFEIYVPAAAAAGLWRALQEAGREDGLALAGLAARDSLRLEAGMPLYGHELDTTTTPYEAKLGRVVALQKQTESGDPLPFQGREALAARAHCQPARVLVGLRGLSRRAARAGYSVLIGTTRERAATIGQVTSGIPSPTLGYPIAMAYVTPEFSAEGTVVGVDIRGSAQEFEVVRLPFYKRAK